MWLERYKQSLEGRRIPEGFSEEMKPELSLEGKIKR